MIGLHYLTQHHIGLYCEKIFIPTWKDDNILGMPQLLNGGTNDLEASAGGTVVRLRVRLHGGQRFHDNSIVIYNIFVES